MATKTSAGLVKEEARELARLYRLAVPEATRKAGRKYYLNHRQQRLRDTATRAKRNPSQYCEYAKRWARCNRSHRAEYRRKRRLLDPKYRLRDYLSGRIRKALKGMAKSIKTVNLIGCSVDELWLHLEQKFKAGMSRDNYGRVWHVDHIIPCVSFDLIDPEQQKRCFNFTNLQPLFASDNIRKGARIG